MILVCADLKIAYFPVNKNASTTYGTFFKSLGWASVSAEKKIFDEFTVFSHIQHPWTRYVKGICQLAHYEYHKNYQGALRDPKFKKHFIDPHLLPISVLTPYYNQIHFIPIDTNLNSIKLTNDFLEMHNSDIRLTNKNIRHQATDLKKIYYTEFDKLLQQNRQLVDRLYATDYQLYRYSVDYYTRPKEIVQPQISEEAVVEELTPDFLKRMRGVWNILRILPGKRSTADNNLS